MKRTIIAALLSGSLLLAGACSEDDGNDESEEQTQQQGSEQEESASAQEPTADQVPVPEDFSSEAKTKITEDNYEQELERLSKKIEGSSEQ